MVGTFSFGCLILGNLHGQLYLAGITLSNFSPSWSNSEGFANPKLFEFTNIAGDYLLMGNHTSTLS